MVLAVFEIGEEGMEDVADGLEVEEGDGQGRGEGLELSGELLIGQSEVMQAKTGELRCEGGLHQLCRSSGLPSAHPPL